MAEYNMRLGRSMERKGIAGYMGSEGGSRGRKSFERMWDQFIQQAANNRANLELGRLLRDFTASEATSLFPKAREAAVGHLERSMGHQVTALRALDQAVAD